jgi:two-component system, sensor histidine kinase PdtaS
MKKPGESREDRSSLRNKIIGLGETSFRKSYFPQLQAQLGRFEQFRMLFDHTEEGMYLIDGSTGVVIDVNKVGAQFFDADPALFSQSAFADHFPGPQREVVSTLIGDHGPAGDSTHTITLHRDRDGGHSMMLEFTITTAVLQSRRFLLVLARDVTERHRAEQQLRSSLREKEALLREVHHRVKNNLQIISSLLHMQAAESSDPQIQTVFQESQTRVRSMALVHERLYQSGDFSGINFRDYIPAVGKDLLFSYGRTDIALSIDAEDIHLAIDSAIPCGLIINELISNCLKHAFPHGRRGTITMELHTLGEDKVRFVVRDDGVGFPPDKNLADIRSMGIALVQGLTQQLDGTIELQRMNGTAFTLEFPLVHRRPA